MGGPPVSAAAAAPAGWRLRLYGGLLAALGPVLRLRLAWRARREPGYGRWVGERFGRYDDAALEELRRWATAAGPRLWLHAVSLGEARAAAPLVAALREHCPGLRIVWTHGTATGREAGAAMLGAGDLALWLPIDAPGPVRRFFDAVRPPVGVLMETEVWPQLAAEARRRGVPLVLANARLSERSLARGRRWQGLLRPALQGLQAVLAQTPEDAERLVQAGAPAERVRVEGNLKFDVTPPPQSIALGQAWRRRIDRPVLMIASSREGEEAALLAAWRRLAPGMASDPAGPPLLLIVPRHPQRFDAVAQLAEAAGYTVSRRSRFGEAMPARHDLQAEVWIGDSLGEMPAYYAMADAALLGGSFEPLGGQNLIEAAACGCPVWMGPHTFNFEDASRRAEEAGAAHRAPDLESAVRAALAAMATGDTGPAGRQRAVAFAARHRGAADRMARAIAGFLAVAPLRAPAAR